jgi:hypothetical protein
MEISSVQLFAGVLGAVDAAGVRRPGPSFLIFSPIASIGTSSSSSSRYFASFSLPLELNVILKPSSRIESIPQISYEMPHTLIIHTLAPEVEAENCPGFGARPLPIYLRPISLSGLFIKWSDVFLVGHCILGRDSCEAHLNIRVFKFRRGEALLLDGVVWVDVLESMIIAGTSQDVNAKFDSTQAPVSMLFWGNVRRDLGNENLGFYDTAFVGLEKEFVRVQLFVALLGHALSDVGVAPAADAVNTHIVSNCLGLSRQVSLSLQGSSFDYTSQCRSTCHQS